MDNDLLIGAMDSSSDGILISDAHGMVVYINEAYEEITGLESKEMIGKNLKDLLEKGVINKALSLEVIKDKKRVSTIHKYVSGKTALSTASPINNANDELIGVVNNTRNISELIHLKNDLTNTKKLTLKYSEEIKRLRQHLVKDKDFVYRSRVMEETIELASKVSGYDSTVLIQGESGTGKEILSKFIHSESPRKEEAFIKVNCAAIPKDLFESELFGYSEGAFTGAKKEGKPGMFELANNGTILLDEVGELPLPIQSKLLRVIQEREVYRVGGKIPVHLDVRIIAATNRDLKQEVKDGNFREDLYFRLNVIPITIPPLRERREDIPELIIHFLEKLNRKYKRTVTISQKAIEALASHSWPGNVRELENIIEYLFIMANKEEVQIEDLPTRILSKQIINNYERTEDENDEVPKLTYLLELYEKYIIKEAMESFPSLRKAAQALGISPSTLCRRLKKFEIEIENNQEIKNNRE
ncbi:sigma-54 interaction domain-containing protein [Dehalobacterium formicoaceticum]|uniref:sigma-54 interaction domain-containing protein n=1 Tax=Dehalobacterium formicoaceticum TaxID=51515 RepID=UPI001FA85850|nr:sigma 54-interacting transcriptional regulator [Dehalobacterium formicoaceticum]